MIPNQELTKEEALFLVEEYHPKSGGRIDGKTMDKYFVPARSLMLGKKAERPGCACMFKSFVQMTNSMYSQHEIEIRDIAYPKPKKRGRKTKNKNL